MLAIKLKPVSQSHFRYLHPAFCENMSLHSASRLEERDAQLQNELAIANDRYTELLRAHVDQLERIKLPNSDNASVLAAGAEATNQSEVKAEVSTPSVLLYSH